MTTLPTGPKDSGLLRSRQAAVSTIPDEPMFNVLNFYNYEVRISIHPF